MPSLVAQNILDRWWLLTRTLAREDDPFFHLQFAFPTSGITRNLFGELQGRGIVIPMQNLTQLRL